MNLTNLSTWIGYSRKRSVKPPLLVGEGRLWKTPHQSMAHTFWCSLPPPHPPPPFCSLQVLPIALALSGYGVVHCGNIWVGYWGEYPFRSLHIFNRPLLIGMREHAEYKKSPTSVSQIWDFSGDKDPEGLAQRSIYYILLLPQAGGTEARDLSSQSLWIWKVAWEFLFPSNRLPSLASAPEARCHGCLLGQCRHWPPPTSGFLPRGKRKP